MIGSIGFLCCFLYDHNSIRLKKSFLHPFFSIGCFLIAVSTGGAFARYRVGDMYWCVGLTNQEDRTQIPRFEYIDRVPWIIDIAGFTRISENGIKSVIQLSGQPVTDWIAVKEYNEKKRPYLHLYIEVKKEAQKKR